MYLLLFVEQEILQSKLSRVLQNNVAQYQLQFFAFKSCREDTERDLQKFNKKKLHTHISSSYHWFFISLMFI